MLLRVPDKKAMWSEIVLTMEKRIESGLFYLLMGRCYLDNLENGKAVIVTETRSLQSALEHKAYTAIKKAIQEVTGEAVHVAIVVGRPRIIENDRKLTADSLGMAFESEEQELAFLHQEYGDIMGIVNGHYVFRQACKKLEQGGWGIFPELLTDACKEYGVMTVLNGLRDVANRPKVTNPRAFFFELLKKGKFGHRLAVSAPSLGRVNR